MNAHFFLVFSVFLCGSLCPLWERLDVSNCDFWVEFVDDRESNLFTAVVHRQLFTGMSVEVSLSTDTDAVSTDKSPSSTDTDAVSTDIRGGIEKEPVEDLDQAIIRLLSQSPTLTATALGENLRKSTRTIERQLVRLQEEERLKRCGPRKGGHWQVIPPESNA